MSNLADVIKQISVDARQAATPDKFMIGHVTACPTETDLNKLLEIQISDKIILKENDRFLRLTKMMKEKKVPKSIGENKYSFYFHSGNNVLLIRMNEGSEYVLLDVI